MWSLPSNPYLHTQGTTEERRKKKSSSSTGEAVSLLVAIDNVVRSNKTSVSNDGPKLNDRLYNSGHSRSPVAASLIDQVLNSDVNENDFGNNNINNDRDNPWALDQLLSDDQILLETMPTWKKYARIILPHIGLILLSVFYVVGGAMVFYHIERPNEIALRRESLRLIKAEEQLMLQNLWQIVNDNTTTKEQAERTALEHVDNVSRILFEAFDTHYISISHLRHSALKNFDPDSLQNDAIEYSWTITTAIFFTTTLLTTIGYGNLVPVTATGRMFCIFYALFGVPLILITVADIGKFLSEKIIWLYGLYAQAKKRIHLRLKQKRILSRKKHKAAVAMTKTLAATIGQNSAVRFNSDQGSAVTSMHGSDNESNEEQDSLSLLECDEDKKQNVHAQMQELGLENYISIPIALIAAILLGYMTIGAVLLANWENWRFFEGFYFSFITMTTVGFGDIVPIKQQFFFFDLFYIIVGLAITTMCIDLVGIEYIEKIHYFGRAISGARFALVNVGGKIVRVPDLMRCAYVLHQKYGQKKGSLHSIITKGAYAPKDLAMIRFIDFSALASFESLTSLLSSRLGSMLDVRRSSGCESKEPSLI